jgi:hypothetical protein
LEGRNQTEVIEKYDVTAIKWVWLKWKPCSLL